MVTWRHTNGCMYDVGILAWHVIYLQTFSTKSMIFLYYIFYIYRGVYDHVELTYVWMTWMTVIRSMTLCKLEWQSLEAWHCVN